MRGGPEAGDVACGRPGLDFLRRGSPSEPAAPARRPRPDQRRELLGSVLDYRPSRCCAPFGSSSSPKSVESFPARR
jgi:hypothetical protein